MDLPDTSGLKFESVTAYALVCAGLILPALFVGLRLAKALPKRLRRTNFQGIDTPVIGGLALLLAAMPWLSYAFATHKASIADNSLDQLDSATIAFYGFGLLGLLDDWFGDRSTGGFKGHFGAFFRRGRITTGFLKAVGGGALALISAYHLAEWTLPLSRFFPDHPAHDGVIFFALSVLLYAAWIALSANTLNLLDLRPGRALFAATPLAFAVAYSAGREDRFDVSILALGLFCFTATLYLFDRAGKIMLGDCGSNALGAVLAVCWVCVLKRWEIAIGVMLLVAFQAWCEKHSLSKFIESKPWLRALDRKIGIR